MRLVTENQSSLQTTQHEYAVQGVYTVSRFDHFSVFALNVFASWVNPCLLAFCQR